jgi:DNA-binding MarR family transcriptional regulator
MPLPRLVVIAGGLTGRRWHQIVEQSGLPSTGLVLLSLLNHRDGLTHREAARMCWVTPGTLTPIVDRLERDGLVERRRADGDRRVVHLFLTPKGAEQAAGVRRSLSEEMGTWNGGLSEDELAVVRRYLITTIRLLQDRGNCE